jgi:predicted MFS family arabinose efflux permease
LSAGLLLAPQGIGAAVMLPISGRLTDRIGGGPVVVAGCSLVALATLPLAFVSDHTPYALLGGVLFIRGLGLGASIQPATAAAYAVLNSSQVPRATAALNTVRQIGGSIGTALLAVVLQHEAVKALSSTSGGAGGLLAPLPAAERAQISTPVATAFGHTFMWAAVLAILAIVPAIALLRAEHAGRAATSPRPPRTSPSTISPAVVGEVPPTSVPPPPAV